LPSATLAYRDPFNTGNRPYLALRLTGINGASGRVTGLIDSGADITQLPLGYASLMGYDGTTLEPMTVGTAAAPTQVLRATRPCAAYLLGLPEVQLSLLPVFSASPYVLWGRTDFMATFTVTIDEKKQRFTLQW
jgi:hypothetical protein